MDEYLRAAHEAGLRDVRLIHGRGIGVQRARVQQVVRDHPLVESFADAPESHLGATVVRLANAGAEGLATMQSGRTSVRPCGRS